MKGIFCAAMGVFVLLGACSSGESAWLTFGGDAGRAGFTEETPTLPMSTLWKFYFADPRSEASAAAAEGRVYFAARRWLFCLDLDTGARLWEFDAKARVHSSPLLVGNLVIFGDDVGVLRALDSSSGEPRWEKQLEGAILSSPLSYQEKILVGLASQKVVALNPENGETIWTAGTEGSVGLPLAAGGNIVFAVDRSGFLYALEASSGRLLWKGESQVPLSVPPVVSRQVLYLVSGNYLYGITLRGSVLWKALSDRPLSFAPAVAGDTLYMTGSDGRLYAMGARNGSIKWVYDDPEVSITASPVVAGETVLAGGSQGTVIALEAASGKPLWKCQSRTLNSPPDRPGSQSAVSQPVFADGRLLVVSNDGNLTCFSPEALDLTGPTITDVGPSGRQVVSGQLPLAIKARFFDEGSGLDADSIEIYLDGEKGEMEKDPVSGAYFYLMTGEKDKETIADGTHTVTLIAKDYRGNTTTVAWKFVTDKSITPPERLIPESLAERYRMAQAVSGGRFGYGRGSRGGYSYGRGGGGLSRRGQGFLGGGGFTGRGGIGGLGGFSPRGRMGRF